VHRYSTFDDSEKLQTTESVNGMVTYNELVRDFYANHVCLNSVAIEKLEKVSAVGVKLAQIFGIRGTTSHYRRVYLFTGLDYWTDIFLVMHVMFG